MNETTDLPADLERHCRDLSDELDSVRIQRDEARVDADDYRDRLKSLSDAYNRSANEVLRLAGELERANATIVNLAHAYFATTGGADRG